VAPTDTNPPSPTDTSPPTTLSAIDSPRMAARARSLVTDAERLNEEHRALAESCGLVDRCERGKLALGGPDAKIFLAGQVSNDTEALQAGGGCYAAFLTHKGKMLGDMRVLDSGEELLLDTERVALQALFDMIRRFKIGYDVELHKRTLECALLSLVGPASREVAGRVAGYEEAASVNVALPDDEHAHVPARIAGREVRMIATDRAGVDVLCDASDREAVNEALIAAGAQPVSEAAAEIVRVERGRPRYGVDLDDTVIPQEAGLNERAVSFTKGCYVGQETVARLHYRGKPNRHLRGLLLSAPAPSGEELHLGERVVGHLGSSVVSPTLGPIALALVRREAEPGATVSVGEHGTAEVLELPFTP
jgi:tRNA-modifying protein YgfZ